MGKNQSKCHNILKAGAIELSCMRCNPCRDSNHCVSSQLNGTYENDCSVPRGCSLLMPQSLLQGLYSGQKGVSSTKTVVMFASKVK